MWWVIHMCRGFDPLFSLWQDRARSFWGIFLIHQQQSYLLGYKNYQFLQKSIFLAPNSIFSSIFLGPIFSGQRHTPISFQAEYPPPPGLKLSWKFGESNWNPYYWVIVSSDTNYVSNENEGVDQYGSFAIPSKLMLYQSHPENWENQNDILIELSC